MGASEAWLVSHFEGGTQTEGFLINVLRRKFGPRRYEDIVEKIA
jgi:hypothetical protein